MKLNFFHLGAELPPPIFNGTTICMELELLVVQSTGVDSVLGSSMTESASIQLIAAEGSYTYTWTHIELGCRK